ncbi:MAG: hypothetical protein DME72_08730 [Verrucomicrobia bacterium]|nr:MAG: hypothetical protein DME72_08730 [Verrucomicrobiota bacterium]
MLSRRRGHETEKLAGSRGGVREVSPDWQRSGGEIQPEGRVNAEARLLAGEVQLERGNFADAGKAFKGVALLYDDPAITPRALDKAALAFRQAGNTEEADRLSHELRERYPNYAGG